MSTPTYSLPSTSRCGRPLERSCGQGHPAAAAVDEAAAFPHAVYDALRAADLYAVHVPEQYGGHGADALAACLVIEEDARGCASSSLIPAVNKLESMPLLLAGTDEQKAEWLTPLAAGEALLCYALSEPDAGSDVASMTTKAVRGGSGWVLEGAKRWITNAGEGNSNAVFAVTDAGSRGRHLSCFMVSKRDHGVSFGPPERELGIKGSPTLEVHLDDVRLPEDHLVGEPGEGMSLAMRTLDHTRVTIAAQAAGIAQGALDLASSYVQERQQFGRPIGEFHQGVQFMLADMAMKLEAARQLTYAAAARSERGDADLTFFSAAARCFASDTAMAVTVHATQLLGGYGYTRDFSPNGSCATRRSADLRGDEPGAAREASSAPP